MNNKNKIMLPQPILDKIKAKFGKDIIYSSDCEHIAHDINIFFGKNAKMISPSTIKRMFGLVGVLSPEKKRTPHLSTMDILAKWLGYVNYKELLREIGNGDEISEFFVTENVPIFDLSEGVQIQVRYDPCRLLLMTYLGRGEFVINESINSKLKQGDRLKLTNLTQGQELFINEVSRNGKVLGAYRAAKESGITSIEII